MTKTKADDTKADSTKADDATSSPTGTSTGADAMAAGSNSEGATKGYLGQDAADQVKAAEEAGDRPDARLLVTPTTFEGAQPPAGHVADPTSEGHVGSTGDDAGKTTDPRPASAQGSRGTSADNADQAEAGTQTGTDGGRTRS